ncbi:Hypothetical protein A7982_01308 [Minicystis rosea]|nr:Hypothetical protein A7982_01308 [Minicystis rosea]
MLFRAPEQPEKREHPTSCCTMCARLPTSQAIGPGRVLMQPLRCSSPDALRTTNPIER